MRTAARAAGGDVRQGPHMDQRSGTSVVVEERTTADRNEVGARKLSRGHGYRDRQNPGTRSVEQQRLVVAERHDPPLVDVGRNQGSGRRLELRARAPGRIQAVDLLTRGPHAAAPRLQVDLSPPAKDEQIPGSGQLPESTVRDATTCEA